MNQLTVVLVTYQKNFFDTPSSQMLYDYAIKGKISLVVYENKSLFETKLESEAIDLVQTSRNDNLALPYNYALKKAAESTSEWLLLLDHDTKISSRYIDQIVSTVSSDYKAILPQVISAKTTISPLLADKYISLRDKETIEPGPTSQNLMAINSGTVLSVNVMRELGGFNKEFPLDFLDHWIFWCLNQVNKKYLVLDQEIEHSLSVQDPNSLSLARYQGILAAELHYYQNYNRGQLRDYRQHLLMRSIKQFLQVKNRSFWKKTFAQFQQIKKRD